MVTGGHRVISVIARIDASPTYVILKVSPPLCKVGITIPITDKELEAPKG